VPILVVFLHHAWHFPPASYDQFTSTVDTDKALMKSLKKTLWTSKKSESLVEQVLLVDIS
jgi:hypothetical protein